MLRIRDMAQYPLTIYSAPVQAVLTWVLPFGFVSFYPGGILLGIGELERVALLAPLVALLCAIAAYLVFSLGLRRYQDAGA